ncbi:hypothetical protein PIB30_076452 [Stylosanthes scabra]|uniref:Uncharacterized protein n=1 Tax=Stylosanthes scabra TaxID=79078 RepID=A0ABU6XPY6_9FABA|nr:hypothetical protein [Stylosanthes scabra]
MDLNEPASVPSQLFMAHAGTPPSAHMPDLAPQDHTVADTGANEGVAPRGEVVEFLDAGAVVQGTHTLVTRCVYLYYDYYSLYTITSSGASLVAIFPCMANLSAKTTSLVLIRPVLGRLALALRIRGSGIIVGPPYDGQ